MAALGPRRGQRIFVSLKRRHEASPRTNTMIAETKGFKIIRDEQEPHCPLEAAMLASTPASISKLCKTARHS
jgi:hypothetical protein